MPCLSSVSHSLAFLRGGFTGRGPVFFANTRARSSSRWAFRVSGHDDSASPNDPCQFTWHDGTEDVEQQVNGSGRPSAIDEVGIGNTLKVVD